MGYVSNVSHVAYGKQDAWKTSAAMSTVGGEQLMRITSPTVGNALKGLLPGLTVLQQADEPRIRLLHAKHVCSRTKFFCWRQQMLVFR